MQVEAVTVGPAKRIGRGGNLTGLTGLGVKDGIFLMVEE